jgi:glycosyltransferase involved in cell wall biosynthesis
MLVNTYYEPEIVGGAEKSVQKLAEAYVKSGNEVTVLCTCKNEKKSRYINGVKVIRIHPNNFGRRYDLQFEDFSKYPLLKHIFYRLLFYNKSIYLIDTYNPRNFKIISEIIKPKPDVIHTNGLYEIIRWYGSAQRKMGLKLFIQ